MTTAWQTVRGEWLHHCMSDGSHERDLYVLVGLDPPTAGMTDDEWYTSYSEMCTRFKGTWWAVKWPEHAKARHIDDASIHGPFATEQAADAHRSALGEARR